MTGGPDFGELTIRYVPDGKLFELKSLRDYLTGFRERRILQEEVVNEVLEQLVADGAPRFVEVEGVFNARGGMTTRVLASAGTRGWKRRRQRRRAGRRPTPPAPIVDLGLSGRTALVCGASSGLGLATAEALAAEGANVAMFARRADELAANAERIGALAVPGDVTSDADLERAVSATVERFGGLDVLVWNGGGPPAGKALDADPTRRSRPAFRLLLRPAVMLVRLALPHLERSAGGRILAITLGRRARSRSTASRSRTRSAPASPAG